MSEARQAAPPGKQVIPLSEALGKLSKLEQDNKLVEADDLAARMLAAMPEHPHILHLAGIVSYRNGTHYCHSIHGAIAAAHLESECGAGEDLVADVKHDFEAAEVSPKLKALLNIAAKVQVDGKLVTADDITRARGEGATDFEIHDAILIAAAFCMYNRYVDGLATVQPDDVELYRNRGRMVARGGYVAANLTNRVSPGLQAPALVEVR